MPEAPKIFLSVSTPDLRSTRQTASAGLLAMGCQPVIVEQREPDSRAFWCSLQLAMRECGSVVHVVGRAYGGEPVQRQPAEHRRSYAQLEYDLAVTLRRPLSIIVCGEKFPFDAVPPEDVEKQRLQETHRAFVQAGGRAFQVVANQAELQRALAALRAPASGPLIAPPASAVAAPAPAPALPPPLPLPTVFGARRRIFPWVALALVLCIFVFIGGVGVLGWIMWKREPAAVVATPAPARAAAAPRISPPAPTTRLAPTPPPLRAATPRAATPRVAPPRVPATVPGSVIADGRAVDAATRTAIIQRIELAPDIPADKKERVREFVRRAKDMRSVLTIPFGSGQSQLASADLAKLRELLRATDFASYREDPTCAFIVLGFADSRGADEFNLRLSTERARTVLDLLRREGALQNVMHPVGMGKTTLLDEHQLEKNRIVEVWAIRL